MKRALIMLVAASMLLGLMASGGAAPPKKPAFIEKSALTEKGAGAVQGDNVSKFMQAKLLHSQKTLEALVLEDYNGIARHSQELSLLSQAALWQVLQTPEYRRHSDEFRRAADDLTKAGKEKNLDGAALAYVELTLKCVQCHKYMRRVRMVQLDPPAKAPVEIVKR